MDSCVMRINQVFEDISGLLSNMACELGLLVSIVAQMQFPFQEKKT